VRSLEAFVGHLQKLRGVGGQHVRTQRLELVLHVRVLVLEVGDAPLGLLAHAKLAFLRPLVRDALRPGR
jgi:hypothetical protein